MTYLLDRRMRRVSLVGKRRALPAPLANLASWRLNTGRWRWVSLQQYAGDEAEKDGLLKDDVLCR